jgi:glycosyltransferase involved in cell wall biosynthesis
MNPTYPRPVRVTISANTSWYLFNYHRNLLLFFRDAGYEVTLVSPDDDHAKKLKALGFLHRALPIRSAAKNPWGELQVLGAYLRIYRYLRPDLAIHFTIKCNLYGSAAAALLDIPHVSSISGLGRAFNARGAARAALHALYRWTQSKTARIVFQKSEDRDYMVDHGIARPEQALVLPGSGVNLHRFQPRYSGASVQAPTRPFTFVFAGRILWEKGFPYLPDALRLAREQGVSCRCLVYGFLNADDSHYVPRETLAGWENAGLLEYRGPVEDVREAFGQADCVVLPTWYLEGVPKSLLEAGAMGIPVVASDRPGCREAVEDGVTGLLCRAQDARSLANALVEISGANTERLVAMGRAARARVEARFDENRILESYLAVADEIISGRGPRNAKPPLRS